MAQWDEVKIKAREAVHRQFARSAVYRSAPASNQTTAITVRLHTKQTVLGDLDREGYAQVLQDVNAMVFDLAEIVPVRGSVVRLDADGREYQIETPEHSDDGRFVKAPVTAYGR